MVLEQCPRCRKFLIAKYCSCREFIVKCKDWYDDDEIKIYAYDEEEAAEKFVEENDDDNSCLDSSVYIEVSGKAFNVSAEAVVQYTARGIEDGENKN